MPLTEDEMKALRLLLREELHAQVRPLQNEMSKRFDEVATQMDGLYQRDEKREQEYLCIREQLQRLEAKSLNSCSRQRLVPPVDLMNQ
jgi:predicted nuclease with TOPRIM domain